VGSVAQHKARKESEEARGAAESAWRFPPPWVAPMIDGWFAVLKKASPRSLGKNQPEGSPKGKERFLRLIDTPFPRPSNGEVPMRREQGSAGETLRRKQ
jgi:hypothetical protein